MKSLPCVVVMTVLAVSPAWGQTSETPSPRPMTLDAALQFATEHYPSIVAAVEQTNAAVADIDVAKSARLPRLEGVWQTNRATANNIFGQLLPQSIVPALSGPVLSTTSTDSAWGSAAGALFSWEPIDLGLRGAQVRESAAALSASRAEHGLTRLAAQQAAASAFFNVVASQQAIIAATGDVERRQVLARTTHTLVDNQLRPGAEASRADAELAAARIREIQARRALAIAESAFAKALGIRGERVTADGARLVNRRVPDSSSSPPADGHPWLLTRKAAIDLAHAREDVLSKTDRPRFYFQSSLFARGSGANVDGTFDDGISGIGLERANWAAGVQVVFPNVFGYAALRGRKAGAAAITRAETARYDEASLAIAAEQRDADAIVAAAKAIAENTPILLASARQSEAQARARYDAGLAGIVEVAEAQSLLAAAEFQDASARVDVWRALLAKGVAQGNLDGLIALVRAAGAQ